MTCTKQGGGFGAYVRCCIEGRIHVKAVALAVSPVWVLVEAEADSEAFEDEQDAAQKRPGEVPLHVGLHLGDESIHILLVAARRRVLALAAAPPGAHRDNIFALVRGLVRAEPEWRYAVVSSRTGSATEPNQSLLHVDEDESARPLGANRFRLFSPLRKIPHVPEQRMPLRVSSRATAASASRKFARTVRPSGSIHALTH